MRFTIQRLGLLTLQ